MKLHRILPALALASMALVSCSEDPEMPPMVVPQSPYYDMANTTILELKTAYWQSGANYVSTIGLTDEGKHIIVRGRVVSSDESGNIYKSVIVADSTASLTFAINSSDLYKTYRFGQEVAFDLTGLKIGGYNGLMQIGGEGTYNGSPSMTFADATLITEHGGAYGLAAPQKVDTLLTDIAAIAAAKKDTQSLISWQSRLVRVDNVSFEDAGVPFAPDGTTNRYVTDIDGSRLLVRCSSYASFAKDTIPSGYGSLVGILSYYGSDWQLLMIDAESLIGFDGKAPVIESPISPDSVNTTIAELKAAYWQSDRNYISQIGLTPTNGHYYVRARVISSDATGNIYKNVVIADKTGALHVALNSKNIYSSYPFGQELIIDMTDLYIGGYNNLLEIGAPSGTGIGFAEPSTFAKHAGREGAPDPAAVDTVTVTSSEMLAANNTEGLQKWQSRL
ncbi:MAG: hypothetical protein K2M97_08210, partial [Muribaculaceae bacterium]|nr:hypothetical protein [Muribaculaceae bacterium]